MKVLLRQDIEKLGKIGEVKEVARGYARNYLIPKGYAYPATEKYLKQIQADLYYKEKKRQKSLRKIESIITRLEKQSYTIRVKVGSEGKLFGIITKEDIVKAITSDVGIKLDKNEIILEEPIKEIGTYVVEVRLKPKDLSEGHFCAKIRLWVVADTTDVKSNGPVNVKNETTR